MGKAFIRVCLSVRLSVGVSVRTIKPKRLKLCNHRTCHMIVHHESSQFITRSKWSRSQSHKMQKHISGYRVHAGWLCTLSSAHRIVPSLCIYFIYNDIVHKVHRTNTIMSTIVITQSVQGLRSPMGSKIAILHWLEEWPLQQCRLRTNVLHCDTLTVLWRCRHEAVKLCTCCTKLLFFTYAK